jgi:predicted GNAT family acetyltransferase
MDVVRHPDARATLDHVEGALRAAGAAGEVSIGLLYRLVDDPHAWGAEVTLLAGVLHGRPAALVTMTGDHPALIVAFVDPVLVGYADLVAAMVAEGRRPSGLHGARPVSEGFARAWAGAGAAVSVRRDVRVFELRAVRPPPRPEGTFRPARADEAELLAGWALAFHADVGEPVTPAEAARTVAEKLAQDDLVAWERDGRAVSIAAVVRRTPWSSAIALVYTPPELRGNGYASAVVAALSQRELDAGREWCSLLADVANPTTNHIYAAIGYEPRCDLRHFDIAW